MEKADGKEKLSSCDVTPNAEGTNDANVEQTPSELMKMEDETANSVDPLCPVAREGDKKDEQEKEEARGEDTEGEEVKGNKKEVGDDGEVEALEAMEKEDMREKVKVAGVETASNQKNRRVRKKNKGEEVEGDKKDVRNYGKVEALAAMEDGDMKEKVEVAEKVATADPECQEAEKGDKKESNDEDKEGVRGEEINREEVKGNKKEVGDDGEVEALAAIEEGDMKEKVKVAKQVEIASKKKNRRARKKMNRRLRKKLKGEEVKVDEKDDSNDEVEALEAMADGNMKEKVEGAEKVGAASKKNKRLRRREREEDKGDKKEVRDGDIETIAAIGEREMKEKAKVDENAESASKKNRKLRKRKKAVADATASTDANKPGNSIVDKKKIRKADGMGLIFMCNAKTKKDCYRYNVFGLPASKKEIVAKVYKGMRLFLFDVDLKLMYGIYKAASPGGYNIEPKAFKSEFPSQVRFTVLNDCLPLPEEKFKAAVKANYYAKHKFNCQLSPEQVKDLCKLFVRGTKASKQKNLRKASREYPRHIDQDQNRRLHHDVLRQPTAGYGDPMFAEGSGLYSRETYSSPPRPAALPPSVSQLSYTYDRPWDESYARDTYSPPPRPVALPSPVPPPPYTYERPLDDYYYRRDREVEMHDRNLTNSELRLCEPIEYRDCYTFYREPVSYGRMVYPAGLRTAYAPPYHQ